VAHDPNRPKVPDLVPLIKAVYEDHCAGCCLHIVTDDGNYGPSNIEYVLNRALRESHPICIEAAKMMSLMTVSQIKRAVARAT
jgi:hypothetical protein